MPERIKILFLIERLARAGTELSLARALERIDRERFELVLCCLNDALTDKTLIPEGVCYRGLQCPWNLASPAALRLSFQVWRVLREEKPDILHTHLFVSDVAGALAARLGGARRVVSTRGRMGIEWRPSALRLALQRLANSRCDLILCKTEAIGRQIAAEEKADPRKIRALPNGVDTGRFAYKPGVRRAARLGLLEREGLPLDGPLVLAVGNLKPIKGHDALIAAAEILLPKHPGLQVAIVGRGETETALSDAIRARQIGAHVRLAGAAEDVRPWMRAADVFAAPSLSEGMPNAVLEAMAMGLPLVLTRIDGHLETAGDAAWYAPPADPAGLAEALDSALAAPEEREQRAQAGLRRATGEFSLENAARKLENIYEELAARR